MNATPAHLSATTLTCDLLASRFVKPELLSKERELAHSCWWDYRGLHPVRRTAIFAHEYMRQTRRFTEKYVNYKLAEYASGLVSDPYTIFPKMTDDEARVKKKKTNLVGLWKARQAADALGIAYHLYIAAIFEKAKMSGWERLPRPTHMYSDKMQVAALDAMAKELEAYVPNFTNEFLKAGSPAPFKDEFDDWLFELGKIRSYNHDLVYGNMVRLGLITQQQAAVWEQEAKE